MHVPVVPDGGEVRPGGAVRGRATGSAPRTTRSSIGMHEASALVCGGSLLAAREIAEGRADRAVNIAGGLHHAMRRPGRRVLRLQRLRGGHLLAARPRVRPDRLRRRRRAPRRRRAGRVLRRPPGAHDLAAPAPDDAVAGHRLAGRVRRGRGRGLRGQRAAAAGHRATPAGCAPSTRSCRRCSREFRPQILVTQCGVDTHAEDPLANLGLSVDGHRAIYRRAARAGRARPPAASGWPSAAAGTGCSGWCRGRGRTCSPPCSTATSTPDRPLPAGWVAHTATPHRPAAADRDDRRPRHRLRSRGPRAPTGSTPPCSRPGGRSSRCTASTPTTPGTDMPAPTTEHRHRRRRSPDRRRTRATRGTGRPTSWPPTAASCTCARSCPATPTRCCASTQSLSERTRYLRYFGPYPRIPPRDLERFTTVDHHARVAFICLLGDEIIAVGRYEGLPGDGGGRHRTSAEVAFVARDDHQGRGLGSILLEHLAAAARENGLRRFEAEVLVENQQMVRVFREAGYQVSRAFAEGVLHLEFDIDPTEQSLAVRDSREQRAEARSVHNVLHPTSVAVIGASTDPSKIGHAVLANLLRGNFTGPVYPVNPRRPVGARGAGLPVGHRHPRRGRPRRGRGAGGGHRRGDGLLPGEGGQGAASWSAPGSPTPARSGTVAERRLVTEARAHGMRVVGPERARRGQHRPGGPAQRHPGPGPARAAAGSGSSPSPARWASRSSPRPRSAGSGLSTFVSAGNRADLSGNDLLQYWQTDPAPTSCCSTWRRSATRASSPGSPAGWPAPSRSSR